MISLQTVKVFVKYDGNSDAFSRVATAQERLLLSSTTLSKIEEIMLHLSLTNSGKASSAYAAETSNLVSAQSIEPSALQLLAAFVAGGQQTAGA